MDRTLDERIFLLALQQLFFRYPRIAGPLLKARRNVRELFECDRVELRPLFGRFHELFDLFISFNEWDRLKTELDRVIQIGAQLICIGDELYPKLLLDIPDPPPVLAVIGPDPSMLNRSAISIVGSRKGSQLGRTVSYDIAYGIASARVVVVSGFAYGIDEMAHRGALAAQGETIAVLGCGLDVSYPSSHARLREEISRSGLLISEFPLTSPPLSQNFPQRNRIISGLSLATVVVEAALRSGSLITSSFALEQGREVLAVPGPAGSISCGGSNRLIRDGAMLVETADDVLSYLGDRVVNGAKFESPGLLNDVMDKDSHIFQLIPKRGAISVDEIMQRSNVDPAIVLQELTRLEISGAIEELPGALYRKTSSRDNR